MATKKTLVASDFAEALMSLPAISKSLQELKMERQRTTDLLMHLTQIDLDIKTLAVKTDQNLTETAKLENMVYRRLQSLDLIEAKWARVVNRVSNVLDVLETKLQQL